MNSVFHVLYILAIAVLAGSMVYYVEDLRSDLYAPQQSDGTITELANRHFQKVSAQLDTSVADVEAQLEELQFQNRRLQRRVRDVNEKVNEQEPSVEITELAESALNSVVKVLSWSKDGWWPSQEGSGFFMSRDGYVVTNAHVIIVEDCTWTWVDEANPKWGDEWGYWDMECTSSPADRITIQLKNGEEHTAWVVDYDERVDVAVLKVDGVHDFLDWGDSSKLRTGDRVIAIGSPLGLDFTTTTGIVSAVRHLPWDDVEYVQFDAAVSFGSSGGPVLNEHGQVIGITTLQFEQGLNLAISSNEVIPIVDDMIRKD